MSGIESMDHVPRLNTQLSRDLFHKDSMIRKLLAQPERRHVLCVRFPAGMGFSSTTTGAHGEEDSLVFDLSSADVQSLHQGLELAVSPLL